MSEGQSKGASPIRRADRMSPAERARHVQDLQRRVQADAAAPSSAPQVSSSQAALRGLQVGGARPLAAVGAALRGERGVAIDQAAYGVAQVDHGRLFGGAEPVPEVTGNPWKIIDFAGQLPAVFDLKRPASDYEARLGEQAVQTEHGLLFQVGLQPKDGQGPTPQRAVLTDGQGQLLGAECWNVKDLQRLLERAPAAARAVFAQAFGDGFDAGELPRLVKVATGAAHAFEVTVAQQQQTRTVPLNNFGLPLKAGQDPSSANLTVADYHLDRFLS
jgi:hypothetical protein